MTNEQEKLFEFLTKFTDKDDPNISPNALYNILTKNYINSIADLEVIPLSTISKFRGVGPVKLEVLRSIQESIPPQYTVKSAVDAINTKAKAIFGTVYDEVDQMVENMVADQKEENIGLKFKVLPLNAVYDLILNNKDIDTIYAWSPSYMRARVDYTAKSYLDQQQLIFRKLATISIGDLRSNEFIFLQIPSFKHDTQIPSHIHQVTIKSHTNELSLPNSKNSKEKHTL